MVEPGFDVHSDGGEFLVKAPEIETGAVRDHITIIFNFFDELRRITLPWRVT